MSVRIQKRSSSPSGLDDPSSQRSCSPLETSQSTANRVSLIQLSSEQKAIRIKLYRNGDKLFRGIIYPLLSSRIRTMDNLMEDLTRLFANQPSLPKGVQCIFNIDGSSKMTSLDEFEGGRSYVVSSSDVFVKLDYESLNKPDFYTCGRNKNMKRLEQIVRSDRRSAASPTSRNDSLGGKKSLIPKPCRSNGSNGGGSNGGGSNGGDRGGGDGKDSIVAKGCSTKNGHSLDANQNKSDGSMSQMSSSSLSILFPKRIISRYDIGCIVGDGNFAIVHECMNRSTKERFALKIIDKNKCKGKEGMIQNEVSILKQISHSNIIQLIEDFDFQNELYLVMEFMTGGDLFDAIAAANKFSEEEASKFMCNLTSALVYLHSLNICHRDIKPENLLICDESGSRTKTGSKSSRILKLGDFGLAVLLSPGHKLFTVCGTPNYVAPEILAEKGYDHAVDIWAAGVIAYVLLCGFPPFVSPENNQDELFDQILEGRFQFTKPFWDHISLSARDLIEKMLQVDLDKRFSAQQVMNHPWLSCNGSNTSKRRSSQKSSFKDYSNHSANFDTRQSGLPRRRNPSNEASS